MQSKAVIPLFKPKRSSIEILKELEDAYNRQVSLLPQPFENERVKIETLFYPLQEISGDFYDTWYDQENDALHGYVIDATGHDICSALQVFSLRELFRCSFDVSENLGKRMEWINRKLWDDRNDPVHAAALMFSLKSDGVLCYTAAGISPVYVHLNGQSRYIDMPGYLLGMIPSADYAESCLRFKKGDWIMFMTDGFSDRLSKSLLPPQKTISAMKRIGHDPLRRDDASALIVTIKEDTNV
ncbi:PP2C family protein-serine/threonine phosphatase [Sporomusa sphaeroides]|uniref:Phosphoserine phosphatase RsbP n=1 Tax=Sporomusa sphaeroides DSM 2875 TaxID=1337886 RepID=A0A1U7M9X7_9FIRM|nr:SpoIIE family protein phosphatase [Sporomusa sphaeroides]OLS54361.1 phosphoserine phosphatase RsbP [Sporomusa sphaeroides DSM 2875]CVK21657.1 Phosphoserine phosphatase RsbP [Sporomusa sphaeroides DSM 2875]